MGQFSMILSRDPGSAFSANQQSSLASIESFKDLKKNHLDQVGRHAVIDGLDGDEIVLRNIKIKDLDAGDCLF